MERAASAGIRRCLKLNSTQALRCRVPSSSASKCVATAICPARANGGISTSSKPNTPSPLLRASTQRKSPKRRAYSSESSIAGTIGHGEAGIPSEAARTADILTAPEHLNEKEKEIFEILNKEFQAQKLEVQDISGGCGSMYGIEVVSERFRGLSMLRQQRLVNEVLGEEIKTWHGVQLRTRAP
ncbi:bola-like protein [Hyaloscypha variabilis]